MEAVAELRGKGCHIGPKSVSVQVQLLTKYQQIDAAIAVVRDAAADGMRVNEVTYHWVLRGLAMQGNEERFAETKAFMEGNGFVIENNLHVLNAELRLYSVLKNGAKIEEIWAKLCSTHPSFVVGRLMENTLVQGLAVHTLFLVISAKEFVWVQHNVLLLETLLEFSKTTLRRVVQGVGSFTGFSLFSHFSEVDRLYTAFILSLQGRGTAEEAKKVATQIQLFYVFLNEAAGFIRGGVGYSERNIILNTARTILNTLPDNTSGEFMLEEIRPQDSRGVRQRDVVVVQSDQQLFRIIDLFFYLKDAEAVWRYLCALLRLAEGVQNAELLLSERRVLYLLDVCSQCADTTTDPALRARFASAAYYIGNIGRSTYPRQKVLLSLLLKVAPPLAGMYMRELTQLYAPHKVPLDLVESFLLQ